jgi:hypothetical protein
MLTEPCGSSAHSGVTGTAKPGRQSRKDGTIGGKMNTSNKKKIPALNIFELLSQIKKFSIRLFFTHNICRGRPL